MPWSGVQPPQEPANYDPNDKFKDPVAYFKHREAAVAEKFVQTAEAKVRHRPFRWSRPRLPLVGLRNGLPTLPGFPRAAAEETAAAMLPG